MSSSAWRIRIGAVMARTVLRLSKTIPFWSRASEKAKTKSRDKRSGERRTWRRRISLAVVSGAERKE